MQKRSVTTSYGLVDLVSRLRQHVVNWYAVAALLQLVFPSRVLPHPRLHRTRIGRLTVEVRLRTGTVIYCPLSQLGELLEIFVFPSYQIPDADFSSVATIVDIGASIGWATLWFAGRAPDARIVALEPDSRWWETFDRNMRANGLSSRVRLVKAAVGGFSGHGSLIVDRQSDFSILSHAVAGGVQSTSVLTLAQVTGLLGDNRVVDVLKIDCEGGEYEILLSAEDALLERVKAIVLEYHPVRDHSLEELRTRLSGSGFRLQEHADDEQFGMMYGTRSAAGVNAGSRSN